MKKREPKWVETQTLKKLLLLFTLIWWIIIVIGVFVSGLLILTVIKTILMFVIAVPVAVILSFLTLTSSYFITL